MEQAYLTEVNIRQVRHLKNIKIELSQSEKKHLLLTGINGCGKTSVLKAIENSRHSAQYRRTYLFSLFSSGGVCSSVIPVPAPMCQHL